MARNMCCRRLWFDVFWSLFYFDLLIVFKCFFVYLFSMFKAPLRRTSDTRALQDRSPTAWRKLSCSMTRRYHLNRPPELPRRRICCITSEKTSLHLHRRRHHLLHLHRLFLLPLQSRKKEKKVSFLFPLLFKK